MTKQLLRTLLRSNYSLAAAVTGWKTEKIFPRAILMTGLQIYFLVSSVIVMVYPKIRTMDDFLFLAGQLVFAGLFMILIFRQLTTWSYNKLNVLFKHKSVNAVSLGITASVAFSISTFIIFCGAVAFEIFISTP